MGLPGVPVGMAAPTRALARRLHQVAGFGAIAALTAAAIAYRGVMRRIGVDRQLEIERRADAVDSAERTRRWEMLMWVYDNIDTADPDRMLAVCEALAREVRTDLEKRMLAAIIEERLDAEGEEVKE